MTTIKPPLVSRRQAADYLGFEKVQTLDNLLYARRGPPRIKLGRLVRFKIEDLDSWIAANREARD